MSKWMLAAGAAALAIASPALADKGGQGGGNKGQGGHAAKAEKGGQGAKAHKGGGDAHAKGDKGGGKAMQFAQSSDKGSKGSRGGGHVKATQKGHGQGHVKVENRGNDRARVAKVDRGDKVKVDRNDAVRFDRDGDVRVVRVDRDDDDFRFVPRWNDRGFVSGFNHGCPPGLAKKHNGCLPPGQAKKLVGTRWNHSLAANMLSDPYRQWYRDDDRYTYRWDDDYIYRVRRDGDLIDALFPYQNRDYYYYPVGASYPDAYNFYNVPYPYQSYYPDGGNYAYRYGDGAIYQVNPGTGMIQGIAALLTGNPLAVGQPLPPAYGVYNVPFAYRDQYYDTPDAMYRYNDGNIYRVDPVTQLITAVISAIV